jgi:tRNA threonylcarbamoyladenosine biosynthesis protein TsaE
MNKEYFYTASPAESEAVGAMLAERLLANEALPRYIALYGDLGVGKTAFVRGVTSVLCPGAAVRSPTFALVHEYRGKLPVFHFDMYRIADEDDLYSIGYDDYLARGGVILVEWSENIPYAIPEHHLRVNISKNDPNVPDSREILFEEVVPVC